MGEISDSSTTIPGAAYKRLDLVALLGTVLHIRDL
jgi:hypothetical protein